jgi:hypothetical protein
MGYLQAGADQHTRHIERAFCVVHLTALYFHESEMKIGGGKEAIHKSEKAPCY